MSQSCYQYFQKVESIVEERNAAYKGTSIADEFVEVEMNDFFPSLTKSKRRDKCTFDLWILQNHSWKDTLIEGKDYGSIP